jgi:hypothetical protein
MNPSRDAIPVAIPIFMLFLVYLMLFQILVQDFFRGMRSMTRMDRTIKITDEVHKQLMEVGGKSETFSDVILRLLDYYKKGHPKK